MSETTLDRPPRDRRPRGVFWLGLLCVFAAVIAVGLSVWVPRLQRQRALDEIARLGGTVYARSPSTNVGERLLEELSGSSSRRVVAVDLSAGGLNNDNLDVLAAFPSMRFLTISGTELTDDGIRRLTSLQHLERLVLVNCPGITEAAERELLAANPGLRISRRGPALLGVMGEPAANGCRVVGVRMGTAAHRGGVLIDDVVTAINGRSVDSFESLARQIARYRPGEKIELTIIRGGRTITLAVVLGSWDRET
jgi:PDZ domain